MSEDGTYYEVYIKGKLLVGGGGVQKFYTPDEAKIAGLNACEGVGDIQVLKVTKTVVKVR